MIMWPKDCPEQQLLLNYKMKVILFPIVTFPPVSVNVYVSVIPTFEKVSVTPSAMDIAALSVKVVLDIADTVVPAVTPVPETTCPTLINELPLSKVTDAEFETAPLTVSVTTSLVTVKSVNLFLIKLLVSAAVRSCNGNPLRSTGPQCSSAGGDCSPSAVKKAH